MCDSLPCMDADEPPSKNLTPLAVSSAKKSVTVQTNVMHCYCPHLAYRHVWIITKRSAIAERSVRRSVSVEILSYRCTNNANRSRVSVRNTLINCHIYLATCIVLYTHRYSKLSYRITSMRCSVLHIHVKLKWTVRVISKHLRRPTFLMSM